MLPSKFTDVYAYARRIPQNKEFADFQRSLIKMVSERTILNKRLDAITGPLPNIPPILDNLLENSFLKPDPYPGNWNCDKTDKYDEKVSDWNTVTDYNNITYVDVKNRSLITVRNGEKITSTIPTMSFVWDEFLAKHLDMVADDGN